ncbi:hypothetical protein UlMin_033859 [Ulmus minor]
MEELGDEVIREIDWDNIFCEFPQGVNALEWEPPILTDSSPSESSSPAEGLSNPSPDSFNSWIEDLLMKDDDNNQVAPEPDEDFVQNFLADVAIDLPEEEASGEEVVDASADKNHSADGTGCEDKEEVENAEVDDDPISKKRKRQLRNRDAAVKSRERKKMYVKDLEMKSKYLEGECRRLGRLLQCCYAENQALRISLQMGNAFGASTTKQESAVLLLESLLLGSLLWLVGIMCLFPLLVNPLLKLQVGDEEKKAPGREGARWARSNIFGKPLPLTQSFVKSRKCKASWTKMKHFSGSWSSLYVNSVLV